MSFFHTHVHSEFSCLDGMADIDTLVKKATDYGQEGIALTDHGNMSGVFQLYKSANHHGIKPFLGLEAYIVNDITDKKAKRHHLTLLSYNTRGYQNLAHLSSLSHQRDHYHYKPLIDFGDLATLKHQGLLDGIACLTGCFFGLVCQSIVNARTEDEGIEKASRIVRTLQSLFSPVYIEVQHHKTAHDANGWDDDRLVSALHKLALVTSCPPIITNDCHYCDKGDKELHDMMKMIAYSSEASEVSFPGDAYHLASASWVKSHYLNHRQVWDDAQSSFKELLDLHDLRIPPLDKYKYFVPEITKNPDSLLKSLCSEVLEKTPLGDSDEYIKRLEYELEVIKGLGMADYFLLVHDYVSWCHANDILVIARGSAAGSLICFLLGFTQVDPLKWNLTFDRFLTPDRIRPPDIDLDIEDVRRVDVIEYLKSKYEVVQIGTYNRLTFDEDTGRGGLFVQYMSAKRKILGDRFPAKLGRVKDLHDLDSVAPKDAQKLRELGDVPLRRSAGTHAAGFVVSAPPSHPINKWIPTMLIPSSDTTVTQMMMDDVEDAGYIKIDLLGLRSLTTLHRCLELLGKTKDYLNEIPLDDAPTFEFLRKGYAETGVFQLEGYTAAKGCREVKVKSIKDLVLVNALYRPATRDSGYVDQFLKNRKAPTKIKYPHAIFKKHLEETYGVPCFQEQVLAILRDLGMPVAEMNDFLKAVKGKHAKAGYSDASSAVFTENETKFQQLCKKVKMTDAQIQEAWALVEGFAAYGFNRAHSTAYSILGYQLAYLKINHPLEFHASLLETTAGTGKEDQYVKETRRMNIRILPASVNASSVSWGIDRKRQAIRRGLTSIMGVGLKASQVIADNAPYSSIEDMISRCPAQPVTGGKNWKKEKTLTGVMKALQDAGALRDLEQG